MLKSNKHLITVILPVGCSSDDIKAVKNNLKKAYAFTGPKRISVVVGKSELGVHCITRPYWSEEGIRERVKNVLRKREWERKRERHRRL